MRNRDIKKVLKYESDINIPDLKDSLNMMLDDYYTPCSPSIREKTRTHSTLKYALALVIVLFSFIPVLITYFSSPNVISSASSDIMANAYTYVSIDINPSIELEVDENKKVVDVRPLNKEAMLLIYDCNFVNMNLEDVITEIVSLAVDIGYIDESTNNNALMITTINNNETIEKEVAQLAISALNSYLDKLNLKDKVNLLTSNSDEFKVIASELGVSIGKYQLINKACTIKNGLTVQEAKTMSVRELNEIINNLKQEEIDRFKESLAVRFKELQENYIIARTALTTKIDTINTVRGEVNNVSNKADFIRLKIRVNRLINEYNLQWEFNYADTYSNKDLKDIRTSLNDLLDKARTELMNLDHQYLIEKNELKKEEHIKLPFVF